jgi:hypothetical protein
MSANQDYVLIEKTLSSEKLDSIYKKLRVYKRNDQTVTVVEKTTELDCAYLWDPKELGEKDALDLQFEKTPEDFNSVSLYGLHTYGGYYVFFRPDLEEVCNLIDSEFTKLQGSENFMLDKISRIYVTTNVIGDGNIGICYDNKHDRHRAITKCYMIYY